jgi:tyrosyl-tRNA synthetase
LIGDPSGKSAERQLLTREKVAQNVEGIRRVFGKFLDFNHPTAPATIVNNLDWFGPMSAIDFLREVGKHFRIGPMLAKESVKTRMEADGDGMSYTEFSYQLLQGYDFYRLYKDQQCVLQLGGSDQWGNITAGIDVIRKLEGEGGHAFGLTMPLVTTSSGAKFGKSEGNAVWLTEDRTTPFDFYQFWLRTEDADVAKYLGMFTFLPTEEVGRIVEQHKRAPEQRVAQRRLADEMTTLVHGKETLQKVIAASQTIYGSSVAELDAAAIEALVTQGVQSVTVDRAKLDVGYSVIDACVDAGLAKTKSDARRLMQQGGLYLNNVAIGDPNATIRTESLVAGMAAVLRSGKRNYRLIRVG